MTRESRKSTSKLSKKSITSTTALLAYLAVADFAVHMIFAGNYGYFRDELYYVVSGTQHLSLGYVDFPPLIVYVAALLYPVSKDSVVSIHVVPALVESLLVFVTGMIARELGGGRKAQLLAAVSTLVTLDFLAFGSLFTPDSFDSLWWSLLAYVVIRIVRRGQPKSRIVAGLVVGLGLVTKLTIFFFVAILAISFLAIPSTRRYLRSKWIVVGALLSILFILPMIYWNSITGWPMIHFYLEFRGDVSGGGPLDFFVTQVAGISILNFPIVLLGLYFYLRSNEGSQLRAFGLCYILLFVFMAVLDMKTVLSYASISDALCRRSTPNRERLSLKERCVQMVWFKTIHRLSNNYRNFTCSNRHSGSLTHNPSGKVRIKRISIQSTARQVWLELDGVRSFAGLQRTPRQSKKPGVYFHRKLRRSKRRKLLGKKSRAPRSD